MTNLSSVFPALAPALIAGCYLAMIFFLRLLDVCEREPIWPVIQSLIAGSISFAVTAAVMFPLGLRLSSDLEIDNISYFVVSVLVSGSTALLTQVIAASRLMKWNGMHFDTATDYLLYYGSVGIGFEMTEKLLLNAINTSPSPIFDYLSSGLYHTSLLNANSIPLVISVIGLGIFFGKNSGLFKTFNARSAGVGIVLVAVSMYFIYLLGLFLTTLGTGHVLTGTRFAGSLVAQAIGNLSLAILAGSFSFAVLHDSVILQDFGRKVMLYVDGTEDIDSANISKKLDYFSRPTNHIKSSSPVARWMFSQDIESPYKNQDLTQYGRIAVTSWKRSHEDQQLFSKALKLLEAA